MPNLHLCDLDLNKNALLNPVIHPVGTAPSNPVEGQIYYDNTGGDKQIYVYDGSGWVSMGGDVTSVVAGTGLTGGGTGGAVTLNVIGGTGITANANDIAITAGGVGTTQLADNGVTEDKLADAINDEIGLNTAKLTNATHTGEVTGSGALTIANNVVDEANLRVSNGPTNGYYLTAQSGATGGMTWAAIPTLNQDTTGNADTATALETGRTIAMTGDVAWTSASFTGAGNVTGTSTIGSGVVHHAMLSDDIISGQVAVTALAQDDLLVVHDASAGTVNKITYSNFEDDIFGNVSGDGTIAAGGALTVTQSAGDFTVTGDLIVSGTTTTINTANLAVEDNNIILSSGNSSGSVINGAGITLESGGANDATITYSTTGPKFEMKLGSSYEDLKVDTLHAAALTIPDNAIAVGKIAAGTLPTDVKVNNSHWSGTVLASSNLDADTAHLTTTQTFTGAKTFTGTVALTGTGRITGIDTVSAATDAASKTYVDAHVWDGSDITSGTIVSARLDADTAHLSGSQTFTGTKTLNSFKGTGSTTVTNILDEDAMGSDSATALATQQSIKAYVDNTVAARTKSYNLIVAAGTAVSGSVASNSDKTWTITHGMGSSLLYMVQVIRTANGSGETVFPCVTRTTTTTVINFNVAPTSGDYTVVIVKI